MPHLSARRRHEICDIAFEMLGGVPRLVHEANKSSDSYMEFMTKLWAKGLPRAVATEHTASRGVEELIDRLDDAERAGNAKTIDGEITDIEDEDDE